MAYFTKLHRKQICSYCILTCSFALWVLNTVYIPPFASAIHKPGHNADEATNRALLQTSYTAWSCEPVNPGLCVSVSSLAIHGGPHSRVLRRVCRLTLSVCQHASCRFANKGAVGDPLPSVSTTLETVPCVDPSGYCWLSGSTSGEKRLCVNSVETFLCRGNIFFSHLALFHTPPLGEQAASVTVMCMEVERGEKGRIQIFVWVTLVSQTNCLEGAKIYISCIFGREQKFEILCGQCLYIIWDPSLNIFSVSAFDPIPELKALRVAQIHTIKSSKKKKQTLGTL
jgi:hypothetical protein